MELRNGSHLTDLLIGSIAFAIGDVLPDAGCVDEHVLLDDADVVPQRFQRHVSHVYTINGDRALRGVIKARDQVGKGGLAASRLSDQRHYLPRLHLNVDAGQSIISAVIR